MSLEQKAKEYAKSACRPFAHYPVEMVNVVEAAMEQGYTDGFTNASSYQMRVSDWMQETFSKDIISNRQERAMRFLEESIELCQSLGLDRDKAINVLAYVFNRPAGIPAQEVGGVMVTLAALCGTANLDMVDCGETELARVNQPEVRAKIQAKQVTKSIMGITPEELKQ